MPISESEQIRIANKIRQRNKTAKWINDNLHPTSKVKMIPAVRTAKKLENQGDVESLERTLDAFLEAPVELRFEKRSSYSMNELAELMALGAESKSRTRERYEQVSEWIADKGVTMAGQVSNIDPLQWQDKFAARYYRYKDPTSFQSPSKYNAWKDKMYAKALGLGEVEKFGKYQHLYVEQFRKNIVMRIDPEMKSSTRRQEAWDIYRALKELSPQEFMYAYYTDVYGDVSFITSDRDNTDYEYEIALDIKNTFGIEF